MAGFEHPGVGKGSTLPRVRLDDGPCAGLNSPVSSAMAGVLTFLDEVNSV